MRIPFTVSFLIILLFTTSSLKAQTDSVTLRNSIEKPAKNLIKINVPALFLNNYSFQYERVISRKTTAGLGFRFMPKSGLPLKSQIKSLVDDDETWDKLDDIKTSNIAFTPEIRFYLGKSVFRGFYVAPFAKFASYKADLASFKYDVAVPAVVNPEGKVSKSIPLDGKLNTITGGVLLGAQWKLSKVLYLDWWILGPQYGASKGHLAGTQDLNEDEQKALRKELEDLDLPIVDTEVKVDSKGARMDIKGPWTGVRAGINIGVRF